MKFLFALLFTTVTYSIFAQSVAINNTGATAHPSSILDVTDDKKGILIPRVTKTDRNSILTPATGLLVYVNAPDTVGFSYYNGSRWLWLANSAADTLNWSLNGNTITPTNFMGSINNLPIKFRVNNIAAGIIDSTSGNVGVGYRALITNTAAGFYANNAFGFGAGQNLSSGFANIAIGRHALARTGGSIQSVAIGDSAMGNAISSGGITALGFNALKGNNGLGVYTYNTALGFSSQSKTTGGTAPNYSYFNTSVGGYSMDENVAGNYNTAMGISALRYNDSSAGNVAIGVNAMAYHRGAGYKSNVALGNFTLEQDSIGNWNTAIGAEAMQQTKRSTLNTAVGFRALKVNKTGSANVALGVGAMEYKDSALNCVAVGRFALGGNNNITLNRPDTGTVAVGYWAGLYNNATYNTFLGYAAGSGLGANSGTYSVTGNENTGLGTSTLVNLNSGRSNTAVGLGAQFFTRRGSGNVALGVRAHQSNYDGNYNIAIGDSAMYNTSFLTNTNRNIGIGAYSLGNATSGSDNVAIGHNAMLGVAGNSSGTNVAVGSYALTNVNNGSANTALGYYAANSLTIGGQNVAIGDNALGSNLAGNYNVAIGAGSSDQGTTGDGNVNIGFWAGRLGTGNNSVIIGKSAAYYNTRGNTVAIGDSALYWSGSAGFTGIQGQYNTAVGSKASLANTSGHSNTSLGYWANYGNTSGNEVTAVGTNALVGNKGSGNNAFGANALRRMETLGVAYNSAFGDSAAANLQFGTHNVVMGSWALKSRTNATSNTAMGSNALGAGTTGSYNAALGYFALQNIATNYNTAIGHEAGKTITTGANTTFVGASADGTATVANSAAIGSNAYVTLNNSMVLGSVNGVNGAAETVKVGIGINAPAARLHVVNTNGTTTASGLLVESNNTTTYTTAGAIEANNTATGNIQVAGIRSTVGNTNKGYGVGGYFQGGYVGLWANVDNTNPGTGANSTWGLYSTANQITTGTNYGVYGTAFNGATNYGVYCSGNGGYTGTWTLISDQKFKKDLNPLNNVLPLINKVQTYTYHTKNEEYPFMNFSKQLQFGYIAQDLEKYFPSLVEDGTHPGAKKDDAEIKFKSVNYIGMIPVLTKAIQEQQQEIEDLKTKNNKLEADIKLIKQKLGIL